ncbi:acyltransferase family protein [Rheinheimera sp. MM224]|uniref:acyltransferase family protein n=1 Tax=Rheinheimera sp. MM224 TaxID=3019969 RepID=UPI0021F87022|nr:acyltransferase [Rheinheimera sp. MM224]CAI3796589.1 hypothetical protein JAMGFMIE_01605 [Rheinheimera sp. MM224]
MKIQSLQILRAIAAWLVVYHHYMQLFYNLRSDSLLGEFFSKFGAFGVDIFFVLSGFVMFGSANSSSSTGWSFFINRLFRVLPTYWFFSVLLISFSYFMPDAFNFTAYTLNSLLYSLFFIPHENPSGLGLFPYLTVGWTLNFEIVFYTILALCLFLNKRYAVYICGIIVISLPLVLLKNNAPIMSVLSSVLMWQFVFGLFVGWLHSKFDLLKILSPKSAAFILIFSIVIMSGVLGYGTIQKTVSATMLVISFIALNNILNEKSKLTMFFAKLGDYSYSTYLCHVLIIGLFLHYQKTVTSSTPELLTICLISILTYIVSLAAYKYIETSRVISAMRDRLINLSDSKMWKNKG